MVDKVVVQLIQTGDEESSQVSWLFFDESSDSQGERNEGVGSFRDFVSAYKDGVSSTGATKKRKKQCDIIALLPGTYITYLNITLPTKNKQQMWQALPFAVEEFVVEDIENMSLGACVNKSRNDVRASITESVLLASWKSLFQKYDLECAALYGFPDILAPGPGEIHVLIEKEYALLKGSSICSQTELDNVLPVFSMLQNDEVDNVVLFYGRGDKKAVDLAKRIKIQIQGEEGITIEEREYNARPLVSWINENRESLSGDIDLLSSGMGGGRNQYLQVKTWVPVAAALMGLVILQIVLNFSSGYYFSWKVRHFLDNGEQRYAELFPDETIVDVESQWNGKVRNMTIANSGNGFSHIFPLVINTFATLAETKNDIKLKQFRYDREEGDLKMSLDVKSVVLLESAKEQVNAQGFSLDILSANEDKNVIKASILIKPM